MGISLCLRSIQSEKCRLASTAAAVAVMLYTPFLPFHHWCEILLPRDFSIWAVTRLPNLSCHAGITVAGTVGFSAYSVSYSRFIQYIRMRWTLVIHLIAFFRQVYQKVHLLVNNSTKYFFSILSYFRHVFVKIGCFFWFAMIGYRHPKGRRLCKIFFCWLTKRCRFW